MQSDEDARSETRPDLSQGRGQSTRGEVARFVPSRVRRLLDVGCGQGGFGATMMARGIEVWGIEANEDDASVAERHLSRVIVGRYPEAMPDGPTFDCITFNDVLEHMVDPGGALASARSYLAEDGCVVASIPNVRHASVLVPLVLHGRWDYQDRGILDSTHLRWFTKATMRELFEENGFVVENQAAINVTPTVGKDRLFRLLGKRREDFLAQQFVVVARLA